MNHHGIGRDEIDYGRADQHEEQKECETRDGESLSMRYNHAALSKL